MGFKDGQIQVALELANGDIQSASALILGMFPLSPSAAASTAGLARAIQDVVLRLDRSPAPVDFLRQELLTLAALLDSRKDLLFASREHVDLKVLADFLNKILEHNAKAWPTEVASAAVIAASLLSAAAEANQTMAGPRTAIGSITLQPAPGGA